MLIPFSLLITSRCQIKSGEEYHVLILVQVLQCVGCNPPNPPPAVVVQSHQFPLYSFLVYMFYDCLIVFIISSSSKTCQSCSSSSSFLSCSSPSHHSSHHIASSKAAEESSCCNLGTKVPNPATKAERERESPSGLASADPDCADPWGSGQCPGSPVRGGLSPQKKKSQLVTISRL